MKRFRTVLFWCHLTAGVTAGLVIALMSVTGSLLAFQSQILNLVDRDVRGVVPPGPVAARVDARTLIVHAASTRPGVEPTGLTLDANREVAAAVAFGQDIVYVNPYTGAVNGAGSARARAFFQKLTDWHRWLGAGANSPWRANARVITGACNFAFLWLAMSGLYLWMPRTWNWQWVRTMTWFDGEARGKARDLNWHHVIGFWCAPVLIVLTMTGVVMSYLWANNLLYLAMGSQPPSPAGTSAPAPAREAGGPVEASGGRRQVARTPQIPDNLNLLWAQAEQAVPTWGTINVRLASQPNGPISLSITDVKYWNGFARSQLTLDGRTGAIVRWEPYAGTSLGQRARGWVRFAHTGELAGWPGQLIAGTACMGGAFLAWTGLSLALCRFSTWRKVKRPQVAARAA